MDIEKQIYIAKYYGKIKSIELTIGLKMKRQEIEAEVKRQKENGIYELYKNMPEEEYEKTIMNGKKKIFRGARI